MTPPILSAKEWAFLESEDGVEVRDNDPVSLHFAHSADNQGRGVSITQGADTVQIYYAANVAKLIAVAIAALPDNHPGKPTRALLEELRNAVWFAEEYKPGGIEADQLVEFCDALAAYLPESPAT